MYIYEGGARGGGIIVFGVHNPLPARCCSGMTSGGGGSKQWQAVAGSGRYPGHAAAATADNMMRVYAPEGPARSLAAFERVAAPSPPS